MFLKAFVSFHKYVKHVELDDYNMFNNFIHVYKKVH